MHSTTINHLTFSFLIITAAATAAAQGNSPQDFLDAHNRARAEVGVPPLEWDDTLADYALQYAYRRYDDCKMVHSMGPYGENLAGGSLSGAEAVGLWVGEESCYDYYSNSCVGCECRHYTQVVWRGTAHLGCARMQCRDGRLFVICSYDPPGNYVGQRPYHVGH